MRTAKPTKPTAKKRAPVPLPEGLPIILTRDQVAEMLHMDVHTLRRMMNLGEFPDSDFKVGTRHRWRLETITAWLDQQSARKV